MKIEIKKVPSSKKEFKALFNSAKIEGTFSKISASLVNIDARLKGFTTIICNRCGNEHKLNLDEEAKFLISDGIYKDNHNDDVVIEVKDGIIDFDEIIESELESIKSDYYLCEQCSQDDNFEKEF
ncbi:MAG: hypothetical protein KGV43_00955 [Arcobacter sp.]|nr:hypothetical protein [Arcobacter sp.]